MVTHEDGADDAVRAESGTGVHPEARPRPTMDRDTLAELHRLHASALLRALLRLTSGDRGRAEDMLQETFLRAWQNPQALVRGPEHGRPWLFTVARRIAIDQFRAQSARVKELGDETPEDRVAPDDPYEEIVTAHAVGGALAELPPHQREVLVELHLNDRSTTDAAAVLGIPPGTVKSRNFYAVRALRPVLERHGLAPADRPLRPV
ncbi:sigma-70 family RNA polymerase sigma factor [Streptomyces sp. NPDC058872]|uniref:sigma-70 family RNA polymerase sigma factor n=1 Tax=Streptomyces sp. NPDC058872 TaxID=3346661 RepID=UPI0036AB9AF6